VAPAASSLRESTDLVQRSYHADVLSEIDHRAGEVLDAIDRLDIRDNTVVIWTSDNGPEEARGFHGTAGFWRGWLRIK